jgi:hypothetical protein
MALMWQQNDDNLISSLYILVMHMFAENLGAIWGPKTFSKNMPQNKRNQDQHHHIKGKKMKQNKC